MSKQTVDFSKGQMFLNGKFIGELNTLSVTAEIPFRSMAHPNERVVTHRDTTILRQTQTK